MDLWQDTLFKVWTPTISCKAVIVLKPKSLGSVMDIQAHFRTGQTVRLQLPSV